MFKIKLDIKKYFTYILFFIIFFSLSSAAMIIMKRRIEERLRQVHSTKLLEVIKENNRGESIHKVAGESKGTKEAVRMLKEFSPAEIRSYQSELRQRIELYQKKAGLLDKKEKELDAFKTDIENRKHEIATMRNKLDEELMLISRARIDLDSDLITFNESEKKNLKRLAGIYASMDALKAAAVLSKMGNETSAKVLASMSSKKSAKILSEINPYGAATISEQMKRLQMVSQASDGMFKERNIRKLAAIYQKMDIERAVSIIEELDNETAVSILSKMSEKKLARILELVETDEASKLIGEIREIMKKEIQKNNVNIEGA